MNRYDVAIFRIRDGQVQSIADYWLDETEAVFLTKQCNDNLQEHLMANWVPAESLAVGDFMELSEDLFDKLTQLSPPRKIKGGDAMKRYNERKANSQCVRCGSAGLFSTVLCEPCTHTNRARVAKSSAETV